MAEIGHAFVGEQRVDMLFQLLGFSCRQRVFANEKIDDALESPIVLIIIFDGEDRSFLRCAASRRFLASHLLAVVGQRRAESEIIIFFARRFGMEKLPRQCGIARVAQRHIGLGLGIMVERLEQTRIGFADRLAVVRGGNLQDRPRPVGGGHSR
ncbi:hypothetical protein [Sphingopyxis macrogoltabida]|uniref:hypothetical protein n=1 Tax=Sphingopyxis macrogoltabida TaxID=33050 RepID=UPI001F3CE3E8|nr:hypothetical protein [Sphingopyxis macrogoltabida]